MAHESKHQPLYPTPVGPVPQVHSAWRPADRLGALRVRLAIGRMGYIIAPGLYALGRPDADSPVVVTANYKLSFDHLRRELTDRPLWILVLDTHGINVWCAAGKGTFGTAELVRRISATRLGEVVRHRTLILPQLGAPGVAAHEVTRQSGFRVVYGPVRAADLPAFLDNGLKADAVMRRVDFPWRERLVLTPVELVQTWKYPLYFTAGLALLHALHGSLNGWAVLAPLLMMVGAILLGIVLTPLLLPWLPGRALAVKGALLGGAAAAGVAAGGLLPLLPTISWLLLIPAISSFLALNFTGCTPYTSLSGVKKETRLAMPPIIVAATGGLLLQIAAVFFHS